MQASKELSADIAAANRNFVARFNAGDAAGLAALYTADGAFLAPNAEPIVGSAEIQGLMQTLMEQGIATIELVTDELEGNGDDAWEQGQYVLRTAEDEVADRGKYLVIWRRVDGRWCLHRDMINTNMPADA